MTNLRTNRFGIFLGHLAWLGIYISYIPGAAGPLNTLLARGRELATKRIARGSSSRDLFHYLVNLDCTELLRPLPMIFLVFQNNEDLLDKEPPPSRQLIDDGILAVVAGSDTTSVVLKSLFFCILAHRNTYEKLQEEIDRFYPQGVDPFSPEHHREMHFLFAIMYVPCCRSPDQRRCSPLDTVRKHSTICCTRRTRLDIRLAVSTIHSQASVPLPSYGIFQTSPSRHVHIHAAMVSAP